ncbi:phage baseplate protein [Megamonas rupellensis]|uniref:phage baseplate protein n=1 Tax=Megamonas rupellensis TaxID=491921 RepID=UPI003D162B74
MPSHSHSASSNSTGNHSHTLSLQQRHGQYGGGGVASYSDGDVWGGTVSGTSNTTGNHSHSITINNTGSNQAHQNMMPYLSVYIWQRIS